MFGCCHPSSRLSPTRRAAPHRQALQGTDHSSINCRDKMLRTKIVNRLESGDIQFVKTFHIVRSTDQTGSLHWSPALVSRTGLSHWSAALDPCTGTGLPHSSPALISCTGLPHSSPALVSRTGLPHWSRALVSRLALLHWSPALVSRTGLLQWSPALVSRTGLPHWSPALVSPHWFPATQAWINLSMLRAAQLFEKSHPTLQPRKGVSEAMLRGFVLPHPHMKGEQRCLILDFIMLPQCCFNILSI